MISYLFSFFIYSLACLLFTIFLIEFKKIGFIFLFIMGCILPFFIKTSDWDWFAWSKFFSIIYPSILISWLNLKCEENRLSPKIFFRFGLCLMSFIAAVNFFEVFYYEITNHNIVNAFITIIIILTIPLKFSISPVNNIVGFGNTLWFISTSMSLFYFYFFNPNFNGTFFPLQAVVILTLIFCLYKKDFFYWITFRLYALFFLFLIKGLYPNLNKFVYPELFHPIHRASFKSTIFEYIYLFIMIILILFLIRKRFKEVLILLKNKKC